MSNIKLVVVGDGAVGKTCLLISYTTNTFPEDYIPTIFDNYVAEVVVNGKPCFLHLWDTAGQSDYDRMRPLSYPDTDVFLVCFSVISPTSFDNVTTKWLPELKHHAPDVPIMLIGTKHDLRNNQTVLNELAVQKQKVVSQSQIESLTKKSKAYSYIECSALTQYNLRDIFTTAIHAALSKTEKKKGRNCVLL